MKREKMFTEVSLKRFTEASHELQKSQVTKKGRNLRERENEKQPQAQISLLLTLKDSKSQKKQMWWPLKNPTYCIPSPTLNHKQPQDNGPISSTNKTMPHGLYADSGFPFAYKEAQEKELLRKRKRKRKRKRREEKRREAQQVIMRTDNSKLLKNGHAGSWTRECDSCRRSACAVVYCQADSAYLCAGCDTSIHAANLAASRHERVWVCESCERAPAAFSCKADAAALCITCDANIHSANALARKHHRVPILPISGFFLHRLSPTDLNQSVGSQVDADDGFLAEKAKEEEVEDETNSWLLLNPVKNINQGNGLLFGNEVEEYLDLDEYNSCTENPYSDQYTQQSNCDSVVPIQIGIAMEHEQEQELEQQQNFQMDYEASKSGFNNTASMNQSVSFSSMDGGVVPDTSTVNTDISSSSHVRPPKGTIDLFSSSPFQVLPTPQFSPMDREARVLRYREKKKTRKFEKTIRYASRKAYAETRPRIKGRFAKRTDTEFEVDQMFSSSSMAENGYGIVPSF